MLRIEDVRVDLYTTSSSPDAMMTLTHAPTGLAVRGCGRVRARLRRRLMDELTMLLAVESR